eukprot:6194814-Pyramimonas_sp.AAC.1
MPHTVSRPRSSVRQRSSAPEDSAVEHSSNDGTSVGGRRPEAKEEADNDRPPCYTPHSHALGADLRARTNNWQQMSATAESVRREKPRAHGLRWPHTLAS